METNEFQNQVLLILKEQSDQIAKISEQQESICLMLNEIAQALNQESETSLIDELSELLQPISINTIAIKTLLENQSQPDPSVII